MTPEQLVEKLVILYPRQLGNEDAVREVVSLFRRQFGNGGPDLAEAYQRVMASYKGLRFPLPAEFGEALAEIRKSRQQTAPPKHGKSAKQDPEAFAWATVCKPDLAAAIIEGNCAYSIWQLAKDRAKEKGDAAQITRGDVREMSEAAHRVREWAERARAYLEDETKPNPGTPENPDDEMPVSLIKRFVVMAEAYPAKNARIVQGMNHRTQRAA